jgi:hypothetical protein
MEKLKVNLSGYRFFLDDMKEEIWQSIVDAAVKGMQDVIQETADEDHGGSVVRAIFFTDSNGPAISLSCVVADEDEWENHHLEDLIRDSCQGDRQELDCVADQLEQLVARLRKP